MAAVNYINAASNAEFSGRTMMLMMATAQNVSTEDPGTADHDARMSYSGLVIRGEEQPQLVAAHVIASNPTIQQEIDAEPDKFGSNVSDNDISFALASIWTARSLAHAAAPSP
jgi:hypothetical protein